MFCKDLKEHAAKIIIFEKKYIIPLAYEEKESYLKQNVCHICKQELIFDIDSCSEDIFTRYSRVRDHCHYTEKYRGAAHHIFNLRYKEPEKMMVKQLHKN